MEVKSYKVGLIISVVLLALLALVVWKKEMAQRWIRFFSRILPSKIREKTISFLDRGMEAFGLLKNFRTSFALVLYTAFIILLSAFTNFLLFKAFGFRLSFLGAVILLLMVQLGSAPPSVPGKIGIFEYMTIVGLSFFGVDKTAALSYGLTLHIVSYLPKIILGFVFMANLNFSVKKAETEFGSLNGSNDMNGLKTGAGDEK